MPGGDVIFSTGNGDYDGLTLFSQSIVRLNGSTLALVDWYTPSDWSSTNALDSDLGSSPAILIPGTTKVVTGSKDYRIFAADYTCLGHLGGSVGGCEPAQVFYTNASTAITNHSGVYNGKFFNGAAYFPNTGGKIYKFAFSSGSFDTTPITSAATYEFPGSNVDLCERDSEWNPMGDNCFDECPPSSASRNAASAQSFGPVGILEQRQQRP